MSNTVTVGISELSVAKAPDILVTYALGSCVGICLYDPVTRIGGLAHIMLPSSKMSLRKDDTSKFADAAIVELIREMEKMGARRSRITAKIAGGAQMFSGITASSIANIGQRNVAAVRETLAEQRIPIVGEDVGKDYGRTLYFYPEDGRVTIKSANKGEWTW
jgi:chemotaxis protein CheD